MLQLTQLDGEKFWVNAQYIQIFNKEVQPGMVLTTRIYFIESSDEGFLVKESPEEILSLLEKWQIRQWREQAKATGAYISSRPIV